MNGIQTLQSRSGNLIGRERINFILEEEVDEIGRAQERILDQQQSSEKIDYIESSRSFSVSNMTIHHEHHIQQRFIDMKRTRYGKQKAVPVHNTVIFGHWNNIIFRAKYEIVEALKKQTPALLKLEV
ncbi:hypothetical protein E0K83_04005 [Gramella sp. BOM4]|nr:hypothetical protein [Christiangramia bathymodioli]